MPDIIPRELPVLHVEDLSVRFRRRGVDVAAVNGVSNGPSGAIISPVGSFSRPITLA